MSAPPFRPEHFRRKDERDDALFYSNARLVTHIDEHAVAAVKGLYQDLLPEGCAVLDIASSWKSHLPESGAYRRVIGLGMNEPELRANEQLDGWLVHDLNREPVLPFADGEFDAAVMAVSAQYLTRPVEVFRDVARVIADGAPFIVTYSDRLFPEKAVAIWTACSMQERARLIGGYFHYAGCWDRITARDCSPRIGRPCDPLFAVWACKGACDGGRAR